MASIKASDGSVRENRRRAAPCNNWPSRSARIGQGRGRGEVDGQVGRSLDQAQTARRRFRSLTDRDPEAAASAPSQHATSWPSDPANLAKAPARPTAGAENGFYYDIALDSRSVE